MKLKLILFSFLAISILSIIILKSPPPSYAKTTSCTVTSDNLSANPGDTFNVTVSFNEQPSQFYWDFDEFPDTIVQSQNPNTNPYTFQVTAPDGYFTGITIYIKKGPILYNLCTVPISTSAPTPAPPYPDSSCTYDFSPKTMAEGGNTTVNVTLNGTQAGDSFGQSYSYMVWIEHPSGNPRFKSDKKPGGGTLQFTIPINLPQLDYPIGSLQVIVYRIQSDSPSVLRGDCNPVTTDTIKLSGTPGLDGGGPPGENPCGANCETALGNIPTSPEAFAGKILSIAVGLAGGIAFILMVIGAIRVLTSTGNPQNVNAGRDMIVAALAGLIFIIFSVLILKFIGVNIFGGGLNPFS